MEKLSFNYYSPNVKQEIKSSWKYLNKILENHGFSPIPFVKVNAHEDGFLSIPDVDLLSSTLCKILSDYEKRGNRIQNLLRKETNTEANMK